MWRHSVRAGHFSTLGFTFILILSTLDIRIASAQPATPPSPHVEPLPSSDLSAESVGFLPAEFKVDEAGAANYSVPIVLPPAAGGASPDLAFAYNSRSPTGPLGPGWAVSGQSSIGRCRRSVEHGDGPGPHPGIAFDNGTGSDAYCLDGQRLLIIQSPSDLGYCPAGAGHDRAVYRAELDPATRVCAYRASGTSRIAYWLLFPRDGSMRRYGFSADSALAANDGGAVIAGIYASWALDTVVDSYGNAVTYEYLENESNGEVHLQRVRYGGKVNRNAGVALPIISAPILRVEFIYGSMPETSQRQDWLGGSRFTLSNRLNHVEVFGPVNSGGSPSSETLIRRYKLAYRTSGTGSRFSRLEKLQECSLSGSTEVCQPGTTFEWLGTAASHASPPQGYATTTNAAYSQVFQRNVDYKAGDVNGDGLQDLVWIEDRNCSGGGISDPASPLRFRFHVSTMGNATAAHGLGNPYQTSLHLERSGLGACSVQIPRFLGTLWFLFDFTGDGRDDLFMPAGGATTGTWKVFPAVSAGAGQWTFSTNPAEILDTGIRGRPDADAYFADFTGDGLPDLLSPHDGISQYEFAVRPMQRSGSGSNYTFQFDSSSWIVDFVNPPNAGCIGFSLGYVEVRPNYSGPADADGDGRADLVLQYVETCENFELGRTQGKIAFASMQEIDGGCSSPPCIQTQSLWYVFRAEGVNAQGRFVLSNHQYIGQTNPTASHPVPLAPGPQAVQFLDANADGLGDLLIQRSPAAGSVTFNLRLGTGRGLAQQSYVAEQSTGLTLTTEQARTVIPMDLNGDRRADIVYVDSSVPGQFPLRARLFGATGFSGPVSASSSTVINSQNPNQHLTLLLDADGDGAADLFRFHAQSSTLHRSFATQAFGGNDFITSLRNGFGARTVVYYGLLANSQFYERYNDGPSKTWGRGSVVFDVFAPLWAVRRALSSSPIEGDDDRMAYVSYRYAGARIQAGGRGFLGFAWVYSEDQQTRIGTSTEYRQDFPYAGRPSRTLSEQLPANPPVDPCVLNPTLPACFVEPPYCGPFPCEPQGPVDPPFRGSGPLLSEATSSWQSTPEWTGVGAAQGPRVVWLQSSNELKHELDGQSSHRVVSSFIVDSVGNTRRSEVVHYDGIAMTRGAVRQTKAVENHYGCTNTPVDLGCVYLSIEPPASGTHPIDIERVRLGRLSLSAIVTDRSFTGQASNRRVSFEYDPATLELVSEVQGPYADLEPDPESRKRVALRTDYQLDSFGNRVLAVQCSVRHYPNRAACLNLASFQQRQWPADLSRVQRYARTTYDSSGRFPVATRMPFYSAVAPGNLNEQDSERMGVTASGILARTPLGAPLRQVDANGVVSEMVYDSFGRERFRRWTVGAFQFSRHRWCIDVTNADIPPSAERVSCPSGALYRVEANSYAGSGVGAGTNASPLGFAYFDRLGRQILKTTEIFQGTSSSRRWSSVRTYYDVLGREHEVTVPYFSRDPMGAQSGGRPGDPLGGAPARTIVDHDELGRVVRTEHPEQAINGLSETLTSHQGLNSSTIYPLHSTPAPQIATIERNPMGEVTRHVDRMGLQVEYGYDEVGNVRSIKRTPASGPLAGQIVESTALFDRLGRRISAHDPDKGSWSFKLNALGEIVEQSDANGHVSAVFRDALGREYQSTQEDPVLGVVTTQREFDTAFLGGTGTRALGLVASESRAPAYVTTARQFSYDVLGRPAAVVTQIDSQTFHQRLTYDHFGRAYQQFDASLLPVDVIGSLIQYSTEGYAIRVREAANGLTGLVYLETLEMDSRGNVTRDRMGGRSDLETIRGYDGNTGRLETILSGINGSLQHWSYGWDKHGNLKWRWNQAAGMAGEGVYNDREEFDYDRMDRLVAVRRTMIGGIPANVTALSLAYDPLGNITSKNGIGYTYAARSSQSAPCAAGSIAGPHAVRQRGNKNYCYDANGNQTETWRNGQRIREVRYNGFGQVETVERIEADQGIDQAFERFVYGPDGARWGRMSVLVTPTSGERVVTWYVGNVEYIQNSAPILRRHIAGVAIVDHVQDGLGNALETNVKYVLKDHLGSTDVVVPVVNNGLGAIQRMSFDAHGQRRHASPSTGVLWSLLGISEAAAFDVSRTTRGFTGHEQLDGTGLVHMNGRVYDPEIGRFIQADSILDPADMSQGLNRYSYVLNNPLSATDPTGTITLRQVLGIVVIALVAYFTLGAGAAAAAAWMGVGPTTASFIITVAGGFVAGVISTGTLRGGLWGAVTAAAFWGIGYASTAYDWRQLGTNLAYGGTGGVLSELQGGNFGHGFVSAFASAAISPVASRSNIYSGMAVNAVVGGAATKLTGGKFVNGAITASFSYALGRKAAESLNATVGSGETAVDGAGDSAADGFLQAESSRAGDLFCQSSCSISADAAHAAAGDRYLGASIAARREVGWRVYELQDGTFSFTYPSLGNVGGSTVRIPRPISGYGYSTAGHTHWGHNYQFSAKDWGFITGGVKSGPGNTLYLAARNGTLQAATPSFARGLGISSYGSSLRPPPMDFTGRVIPGVRLRTTYP